MPGRDLFRRILHVARMQRRVPLGLSDLPVWPEGVVPYAGSNVPGPVGMGVDDAVQASVEDSAPTQAEVDLLGSGVAPFTVGYDTYRLRRLDAGWRQRSSEVPVSPEQAAEIIERAAAQHRENEALVRLFEAAASQLAGLHDGGVYVLLRLRLQFERSAGSVARASSASPPSTRLPAPPELPPPIEEPIMGAVQAAALKTAAATGVPFCEECARAAAQQAGAGA
jgi:hypothetical protein